MGPSETIYIDQMVAACNGGGGPLGHPRVYLNLAPAGRVECPYCSRLYVNRAMAAATGAGVSERPDTSDAAGPPAG
ncbi:MAG TPA: zinc-finger domain-containing protein [Stellaceae bacterium]|nr:zinc-finger domain-containing protein [Stellaceae bacterium]